MNGDVAVGVSVINTLTVEEPSLCEGPSLVQLFQHTKCSAGRLFFVINGLSD